MHTGFTCTRQTITERIRVSRSTVSAPAGDVVVTLERFLSVRVTDSDAIVSIEWEDSGMDHLASVPLVLTYAREHVHNLPAAAFDVLLRVLDRRKGPPVESVIDSHNVTD